MSRSPSRLAQNIAMYERGLETLEMLMVTIALTLQWMMAQKLVELELGVQVVGPGELLTTRLSTWPPIIPPTTDAGFFEGGAEIVAVLLYWWSVPFVGLFGVATVVSALWYGVKRWQRASAAHAGGEG